MKISVNTAKTTTTMKSTASRKQRSAMRLASNGLKVEKSRREWAPDTPKRLRGGGEDDNPWAWGKNSNENNNDNNGWKKPKKTSPVQTVDALALNNINSFNIGSSPEAPNQKINFEQIEQKKQEAIEEAKKKRVKTSKEKKQSKRKEERKSKKERKEKQKSKRAKTEALAEKQQKGNHKQLTGVEVLNEIVLKEKEENDIDVSKTDKTSNRNKQTIESIQESKNEESKIGNEDCNEITNTQSNENQLNNNEKPDGDEKNNNTEETEGKLDSNDQSNIAQTPQKAGTANTSTTPSSKTNSTSILRSNKNSGTPSIKNFFRPSFSNNTIDRKYKATVTPQILKRIIIDHTKRETERRVCAIVKSKMNIKQEMLAGLTDRQGFEVVQTLLHKKMVNNKETFESSKFNTTTIAMKISELADAYNSEVDYKNAVYKIKHASPFPTRPDEIAPVHLSSSFSSLSGDVNEANDIMIHACMREYVETAYKYGVDVILTSVKKLTCEERSKMFYEKGRLHTWIMQKHPLAVFGLPEFHTSTVEAPIEESKIPADLSRETNLDLNQLRLQSEDKARHKLIDSILAIVKRFQEEDLTAIEAVIKGLRQVQLYDAYYRTGCLQALIQLTKQHIKAPINTYNKTTPANEKPKQLSHVKSTQSKTNVPPFLETKGPPPPLLQSTSQRQEPLQSPSSETIYRFGISTEKTNSETIQFLNIRVENNGVMTHRPSVILTEIFNNMVIALRNTRQSFALMPANANHQGKEIINQGQFPPAEILERDYMMQVSHNHIETKFTIKVMLSSPYNLLKISANNDPTWIKAKDKHMGFLTSKGWYINTSPNSPMVSNYVPAYAFICSNMSHDPVEMTGEFIELIQEQRGIRIDPMDFCIQDRQLEVPSYLVPVLPRGYIPDKSMYTPERSAIKVLLVKKERLDEFVDLCSGLLPPNNRDKYPNIFNMNIVDARVNAYSTREEWIQNVMNPQASYYENKINLIVDGIPEQVNLLTEVPNVNFSNTEATANKSTIRELLTGAATLGQRDGVSIPPTFYKVYRGRAPGSWIFEGHMVQQEDIDYIVKNFLKNHLETWLRNYSDDLKLEFNYGPRRAPVYQGVNAIPLTTVNEDQSINEEHPNLHKEDFADNTPPSNRTHINASGQHYGGQLPKADEIDGQNHSLAHYGPASQNGYESDNSTRSVRRHNDPRAYGGRGRGSGPRRMVKARRRGKSEALEEIIKNQNIIIQNQEQRLTEQQERLANIEEILLNMGKKRKRSKSYSTDSDETNEHKSVDIGSEDTDGTSSDSDTDSSTSSDTSSDTSSAPSDHDKEADKREDEDDENNGEQSNNSSNPNPSPKEKEEEPRNNSSNNEAKDTQTGSNKSSKDQETMKNEGSEATLSNSNESSDIEYDANLTESDDIEIYLYSKSTDKLYLKAGEHYNCHDRNHHNYFFKASVPRNYLPNDALQVHATVCEKVIKIEHEDLANEEGLALTIPVNNDNFTKDEIDDWWNDIATQRAQEEYYREHRESLINSLPKEQRDEIRQQEKEREVLHQQRAEQNTMPEFQETVEEPAKLIISTCKHCSLVVANDEMSFNAHEKCCNGVQTTTHYFIDKHAAEHHYKTNSKAIEEQFIVKRYMAFHPARLPNKHLNDTTMHTEEVLDDPKLYKLVGAEKFQVDEIVMLEGEDRMIKGTVLEAAHPRYIIDINGNQFDIHTTTVPMYHAITPATQAIFNHRRFYAQATPGRFQVGDTAMYNDGKEALAITTVIVAEHPNYAVHDSMTSSTHYTTNTRLFHPTYGDFDYLRRNENALVELYKFGFTVDEAREKWHDTPTKAALTDEVIKTAMNKSVTFEQRIKSPNFLNTTPFREREEAIDKVMNDLNNSNYDDDEPIDEAILALNGKKCDHEEYGRILKKLIYEQCNESTTNTNKKDAITNSEQTQNDTVKTNETVDENENGAEHSSSSEDSILNETPMSNSRKMRSNSDREKDIAHIGKTPTKDNWEDGITTPHAQRTLVTPKATKTYNYSSTSSEDESENDDDTATRALKRQGKQRAREMFDIDSESEYSEVSDTVNLDQLVEDSRQAAQKIQQMQKENEKTKKNKQSSRNVPANIEQNQQVINKTRASRRPKEASNNE